MKVKSFMRRVTRKISNFFTKIVRTGGALLGVKKTEIGYDTKDLEAAGWAFVIGLPVAMICFGEITLPIWTGIILTVLIIMNIEDVWNNEFRSTLEESGEDDTYVDDLENVYPLLANW